MWTFCAASKPPRGADLAARGGIGTFISKVPQVEAGLESLVSFTEMMARSGHQAGTSYLDVSEAEMSDQEVGRERDR